MVYLLHPDPWPKARHAKRRMINDGPLDLIAAKLKPGGEFRIATDDPTYLNWPLMVMQRHTDQFEWLVNDSRANGCAIRPAGPRRATPPRPAARGARPHQFRYRRPWLNRRRARLTRRDGDQGLRPRRDRQHAADQAPARVGGNRLHHPRQGRIHEPRRIGQGPRRARHHQRRDRQGRASPRRDCRRRHRRQYRHRPRHGRQCAGHEDGDRHPRDPEPGEEGHAALARREPDRGAGGPLQEPQ